MVESFDRKLQFFAKQLAWIGATLLMLPFCLAGLFLSWQLSGLLFVPRSPLSALR